VSAKPAVSLMARMSSGPPISAAASQSGREQTDSREWLRALQGRGVERETAIGCLYELLVRAARFEVSRRRTALSHVRGEELDDLALQAADDALVAVLAKLDDYRGASRFTTWAYKFALLEAGVRLRRRAWQQREVVLEPEAWPLMADSGKSPQGQAEASELCRRSSTRLTPA
jgi:RNA polymerase sigma-70 factor (ECF subfamily)